MIRLIEPSAVVRVRVHVPATTLLAGFIVAVNETVGPVIDTLDGPVRYGLFGHGPRHP